MSENASLDIAKRNMIEQQLRTWEVLDQSVLDAVEQVRRDAFVAAEYRALAYADTEIPIGEGQSMMPPRVEARLLQALQIDRRDAALEIGTGSGYVTALLARLARHVTSIEIRAALFDRARAALADPQATGGRLANMSLHCADGLPGHAAGAPYDVIAVTGSVAAVPRALLEQLAIGGRMFVIVGKAPTMEARLITRADTTQWVHEGLFETVIAPLDGAAPEPEFTL